LSVAQAQGARASLRSTRARRPDTDVVVYEVLGPRDAWPPEENMAAKKKKAAKKKAAKKAAPKKAPAKKGAKKAAKKGAKKAAKKKGPAKKKAAKKAPTKKKAAKKRKKPAAPAPLESSMSSEPEPMAPSSDYSFDSDEAQ
jgi:hypothetical protein